jgi:uncharacterized protein YueI
MRERLFRRFTMAEIQAAAQTKSIASQKTSYPVTDHNRYAPDTEDIGISTASPSPDPVVRFMAMGAAVIIGILIILVIASFMNSGKYYLVPGKDALEIWRGRFSPTGKSFDRVLHNYRLGSSLKPYYLKQEIYPIIFKYYLEKSDDMLDLQGPTDFQGIVSYLNMAQQFALSDEMNGDITARMNTIKRITLLLKADVAINRGTHRSLELARRYLIDAKGLDPDAPQRKLIEEKLVLINTRLKKMSSPQSKSKNSQPQTAPAQGKSSK